MKIKWDEAPDGYPIWIGNDYSRGDWFREQDGYYEDREGFIWGKENEMSGRIIVHRRPEPVAWDGTGLPPVGVPIEAKHKNAKPEWAKPDFEEVVIVAMGKHLAIFTHPGSDRETVGSIQDYEFRPIPTPEQKAAQERERAIIKMCQVYGLSWSEDIGRYAGKLYDAGYRKTGGES